MRSTNVDANAAPSLEPDHTTQASGGAQVGLMDEL
jgi:hypothetical protein